VRQVDPLEFRAVHPRAQLVGLKEAPTTVGQNAMRYPVATGVLVDRPAAESTQELSRTVDIEEIAADRRRCYSHR
jgi:hypothetical protein